MPVFSNQILQKNRSQTVLLLHGLYTSAGFWLDALYCFPKHRIILLNIDYAAYFKASDGLADLNEYLRNLSLGMDEHSEIIGHSFGTVLSASLDLPTLRRYHVCPLFLADRAHLPTLATELCARLGGDATNTQSSINQLDIALHLARKVSIETISRRGDYCLIPDGDTFFHYGAAPTGAIQVNYRGGHFDVSEALAPLFAG